MPTNRSAQEIEADLDALLVEMAEASVEGDERAGQLLARWSALNVEYDEAMTAVLGSDREDG